MTIVQIKANAPTGDGEAPAPGVLEWVPTRRRNAGDVVVLPAPFKVRLVSGAGSVNVHATSTDWVWRITESLAGLPKVTKYVAVPDVATVNYNALVEVDPETLDPAASPEPAWYAYVDGLAATAAQAQAEAVAAATGFTIGTVTTTSPGGDADATITGQAPQRKLNLEIPRGPQGPALTVTVVGTETGPEAPGVPGPKGDKGDKGDAGGFTNGTDLGTNDLNSIQTAGLYRQSNGTNATTARNYPNNGTSGILECFYASGTELIQTWYPLSGNANSSGKVVYVRRWSGAVWSSWMAHAASRVDQTAGRAMYTHDDQNGRDQLTYGDTGNRLLTLDNGYLGSLFIRRIGYEVYLFGTVKRPPGITMNGTFLTALPAGFLPATSAWTFYPARHSAVGSWHTLYRKYDLLAFEGVTGDTDGAECRFDISWSTLQSWPATLPGTANGSIPFQ